MPELPEVQTIATTLKRELQGELFEAYHFYYPKLLEETSEYDFEALKNRKLIDVSRKGKYLIFEFESSYYWVVHLRMEGKFHLYEEPTKKSKHTHLVIETTNYYVHYLDVRKFSRMAITKDLDAYFTSKNLGPEPFEKGFNQSYLKKQLSHRSKAIKACLLDQNIVAGIGNIYADEILYACQLHPERPASSLGKKDYDCLIKHSREILAEAIEAGGTTIRSYTSALNVTGRFQIALKAYGRYGHRCYRCQEKMKKVKVAGRTSSFCPQCQKEMG